MQKYIYRHHVTDDFTYSCTDTIPFETDDLDKLLFNVFEKFKDPNVWHVNFLGCDITKHIHLDDLEKNIFTLENWFENYKSEAKQP